MVDFAGGYLSSDGGGVFLRELEVRSGLLGELSECFIDRRDQRFVEHSVHSLISQRVNGLVLGFEDLPGMAVESTPAPAIGAGQLFERVRSNRE